MNNIKAKLWRIYYWFFTNRYDEFNSLKEVLNLEYDGKKNERRGKFL